MKNAETPMKLAPKPASVRSNLHNPKVRGVFRIVTSAIDGEINLIRR